MKVRMLTNISGVHNGEHWPAKGEEATVDEATGRDLISAGIAEEVEKKHAEAAPAPEKATARKAESRSKK